MAFHLLHDVQRQQLAARVKQGGQTVPRQIVHEPTVTHTLFTARRAITATQSPMQVSRRHSARINSKAILYVMINKFLDHVLKLKKSFMLTDLKQNIMSCNMLH